MMTDSSPFVNPSKRDQWQANHNAVQHADLRDHCGKLMRDAMKGECSNED